MSRALALVVIGILAHALVAVPAAPGVPGSAPDAPPKRSEAADPARKTGDAASDPSATGPNGFSLSGAVVEASEIVKGGPPKDGIRSVDQPKFAAPAAANWVDDVNPVLGVALGSEAHAYPVHLMEYHQIVNDTIGGTPVVVTYDPISGVPLAFRRKVGDRLLEFGVSGLVYRSNFLFYDRETESLWSQFLGRAISGPLAGTALERVEIRQEPLAVWLSRFAATTILERPEPKRIDYRHSPFSVYWGSETIPFPVPHRDERFHPKEIVVGVDVDGKSRAYVGSVVLGAGSRIVDEFAGHKIRVAYDTATATFQWDAPAGVEVTEAYWFTWKAFHPETSVWDPAGDSSKEESKDQPR